MTDKEKARAYDEAINKAKSKILYPYQPCFVDIKEIFPELKKYENEMIRKELIKEAKGSEVRLFETVTNDEFVAWLEKQVEQKPADKVEPKFKVGDKIYLKPEYRMPDDDTPIANTVFEIRAIDDKHYRFDGSYIFIEDQNKYELVEQRPVAWSEEDKRKIDRIYSILRQASDTHAFSTSCRLIGDKECIELQDFLKSLRPQSQWKPSDEQVSVLEFIMEGIEKDSIRYAVLNSILEQLMKLRKE